jgi:CBS domain-containing protein
MTPARPRQRKRVKRAECVGAVMRRDFVTVRSDERLSEAISIMRMGRLRHLLVQRDGRLVGVLTYRDLQDRELERLGAGGAAALPAQGFDVAVEEAMLDSPYVVNPDTPLRVAAARMTQLGVGCLPVVEVADGDGRLVGLVTEADLLRAAYPVA